MFKPLENDSEYMGFNVGIISPGGFSVQNFFKTLALARRRDYRLLYCRISPTDIESNRIARKQGGVLVEMKTIYTFDLNLNQLNLSGQDEVEAYPPKKPHEQLVELAHGAGEYSRYRVDPNIPEEKFRKLSRARLFESVHSENSHRVLVRKVEGKIVGMISLRVLGEKGEINIFAVDKNYHESEIVQELLRAAVKYLALKNVKKIQALVPRRDLLTRQFYIEGGFKLESVENLYHFWL